MRKLAVCLFLFIAICSFTSCDKNNSNNDNSVPSEDDYYVFDINENIISFDINDEGIYYLTPVKAPRYEIKVDDLGKEYKEEIPEKLLKLLDSKGVLKNTYTIPGNISTFCTGNNRIYYIANNVPDIISLYEFNIETQTSTKLCEFTDYSAVSQIVFAEDKIFYIGVNQNFVYTEYSIANAGDTFIYSGERLGYIDLSDGSLHELPVKLPISFSKAYDNNLVIYAYDEKNGYYFTEYDSTLKSLSEKIYHDMGMMNYFSIINDKKDFLYLKFTMSLALTAASLAPASSENELIPNYRGGLIMKCWADNTYCTNTDGDKIIRIKHTNYFRGSKTISILSTDFYKIFTPFGCGYNMLHNFVTDEEMALALLSQDQSFDICCMNSRQEISVNIRNKGSFYPLNDVKGVKEYLDQCFPYIRDTAVNSDGDIWMLPITVDIPCIIYNEGICDENGIEFSDSMDPEAFFDILKKVNEDKALTDLYNYNNSSIIDILFYQYLRGNQNFDTEKFRKLADVCKTTLNNAINQIPGNPLLPINLSFKNEENFLFMCIEDQSYQFGIADKSSIRACRLPDITGNKTNVASCYYLCVNPASKNLKEALQYISSLCSYLSSLNNTIMAQNRDNYPDTPIMDDLYRIYSDGDIRFTFPNELFMKDFEQYLTGEKDLESIIHDSDRRLETFLNE